MNFYLMYIHYIHFDANTHSTDNIQQYQYRYSERIAAKFALTKIKVSNWRYLVRGYIEGEGNGNFQFRGRIDAV